MSKVNRVPAIALTSLGLMFSIASAYAQQFDDGIPAGWTCQGNCGTSADVTVPGVVASPPGSGSYGWVSSLNGIDGLSPFTNLPASSTGGGSGGSTNASILRSSAFSASSGETLKFDFNYVTSDGGTYADYAWARLLNAGNGSESGVIFTARTNTDPGANVIPGFGMPALNPNTNLPEVLIIDTGYSAGVAGPVWSPLGTSSGTCWFAGCGYTGWVNASFEIASSGNYVLEFGVSNWDDTAFDSGLAFNSVKIGRGDDDDVYIDDDTRITPVPEPETYAMLLAGLGLLGAVARRRKQKLNA